MPGAKDTFKLGSRRPETIIKLGRRVIWGSAALAFAVRLMAAGASLPSAIHLVFALSSILAVLLALPIAVMAGYRRDYYHYSLEILQALVLVVAATAPFDLTRMALGELGFYLRWKQPPLMAANGVVMTGVVWVAIYKLACKYAPAWAIQPFQWVSTGIALEAAVVVWITTGYKSQDQLAIIMCVGSYLIITAYAVAIRIVNYYGVKLYSRYSN